MINESLILTEIDKLKFKYQYPGELLFENYHKHSAFSNTSTPDSGESMESYAKRTIELKGSCLFSGEHGNQGNQFEVYKLADKYNLKYVHSSEVYWVKDRHESDRTNCHMIICALNEEGRQDLNYILSMANIDGYYYKPRIDLDLLLNVPRENFIITSACIAGWNYADASDIWLRIHDYFGDNFFFELQSNNTDPQKKLNEKILNLSSKYNIQTIAGLDSHYINEIGQIKRDQILKYKNVSYPEETGWYMDYPDVNTLIERFKKQDILSESDIIRSILNTNVFNVKCEKIILDKSFKIPSIYKDKTYEEKCRIYKSELNKAYKNEKIKSEEKANGIRFEAKQVIDANVVDYFLTSKKIVEDAVNKFGGILTTTSRGSAASYITNKLIGLTTVDRFNAEIPIYPERFLTTERVLAGQMPDIDLNIAKQEPFVQSAKNLLGEYGCYPLMAVEKLKEKAAWQLYAGANGVEPSMANTISKYIDSYNDAIKHADEDEKEDITIDQYIPEEYIDIFKQSNDYQGITINLKVHACGHMIFDGDIRREIGLISAVSKSTGNRTVCAAIEGGYLDEFGYVKEDFLIVDSVDLTHKFFESIGQTVPSFDELKEMVKNDDATWKIYEKGITCCVNQCEKLATTNKCKRYKPKNIEELASFIAGIRPGFASLINIFLNREPYTTGEESIDSILNDTKHFMIYQESIMKVLSYLGLPMGETYAVIKNISKKKYKTHPEKLEELKQRLLKGWKEKIGNTENFEQVWNVIDSSALYAFNSPHAYSMSGDSLYQAWFKAHYTKKFYEVAITHYQEKGNKNKIDALVKEAYKFYGYQYGNYKFRNDHRRVSIDDDLKVIYPNLSSVKSFGEKIADELYSLKDNQYSSFLDLLVDISNKTSVNSRQLDILIKLDFFSEFGTPNELLKIAELYNLIGGKKQIKKDKIEELGLPIDSFLFYCEKETDKMISGLDSMAIIDDIISTMDMPTTTTHDRLRYELECLGYLTYTDASADKHEYYVQDLQIKKSLVRATLYCINNGSTQEVKMWNNAYTQNVFNIGDILHLQSVEKKNKTQPSGEINPDTGRQVWVSIPDQYEFWLKRFYIKEE